MDELFILGQGVGDDAALRGVVAAMTPEQRERAESVAGLTAMCCGSEERMQWVLSQIAASAIFNDDVYLLFVRVALAPIPEERSDA